jgi:hypothetical protein
VPQCGVAHGDMPTTQHLEECKQQKNMNIWNEKVYEKLQKLDRIEINGRTEIQEI